MNLTNGNYSIEYDTKSSRITGLKNLLTGDEYIKHKSVQPLIYAFALDGGKLIRLDPSPSEIISEKKGEFCAALRLGGSAAATLTVKATSEELFTIEAEIHNNGAYDIYELVMPHITGLSLGNDYRKNIIVYPHHAGEKTVNPIEEYATDRFKNFFRAGSVFCEGVYRREINYCGLASMSFMYYYDDSNGLYFASEDSRFPVTGLIAESGGAENPYFGMAFKKHKLIKAGESYRSGIYKIGVNCNDWHRGAKLYRSYIEKHISFNNYPAFLKGEWGLNQCYNFKKDGKIINRFNNIPEMFDKGMEYGLSHMFIASWNRTGFDSDYPEYYPDMDLGTGMDFCGGINHIKENGGIATLYINARLFDISSDFYEPLGKAMAIKDMQGGIKTEKYGPVTFSLNCPSDSEWAKRLADTAEFAFRAYGASGVYLDQLASAEPFACYDKSHSHGDTGEFNNGYIAILKDLRKRMAQISDKLYLMTENCGDLYSQYVWANLTWNGDYYDEYFNLYKYVFPEFIQVNMVNPRRWVKDFKLKEDYFYKDIERAVLLGSVLWMCVTNNDEPQEFDGMLKYRASAAKFRKNLAPYIDSAVYCDDKYINKISAGLNASCWKNKDFMTYIIGNSTAKGGFAEIAVPEGYEFSFAADTDFNAAEPPVKKNGKYIFTAGGKRLYMLHFLKK